MTRPAGAHTFAADSEGPGSPDRAVSGDCNARPHRAPNEWTERPTRPRGKRLHREACCTPPGPSGRGALVLTLRAPRLATGAIPGEWFLIALRPLLLLALTHGEAHSLASAPTT